MGDGGGCGVDILAISSETEQLTSIKGLLLRTYAGEFNGFLGLASFKLGENFWKIKRVKFTCLVLIPACLVDVRSIFGELATNDERHKLLCGDRSQYIRNPR